MKYYLVILLTFITLGSNAKENEIGLIQQTLTHYIEGTSYNDQAQIKAAFADNAELLLDKKGQDFVSVPAIEYATWFKEKNKGKFNGRIGEIRSIEVDGAVASAKVEILMPNKNKRFVDLFLLKKLESGWKIISKTAVAEDSERNGERILFIVSNAHFHGDSKLPAGVSFGEIVKAYDTFTEAGYTVDFMSPEGGAIPLSYVNTSVPVHKKYLYNSDFMYAIGNTKTPDEIEPSKYKAVHYVGGTNAMYGVAENKRIQQISMEIYEQHGGIISSVCHGTAGIVNLKLENGEYLVKGRRISGYPESYENQNKAYFQEFPFLIQHTIEQRGGQFLHSERNVAHVEVDGRIITGQNHLSSPLVAEKMVEILQALK
ncbi:MAG: nuclear transport factor 2 family protein [Gammaproteobacteria bacterium]|nr:nuclear transport factor 2 family protein [Gammaproteobacteria bacterium]